MYAIVEAVTIPRAHHLRRIVARQYRLKTCRTVAVGFLFLSDFSIGILYYEILSLVTFVIEDEK